MIPRGYPALVAVLGMLLSTSAQAADPLDGLLAGYRAMGAGEFDAQAGAVLWNRSFAHPTAPRTRGCVTCHTKDPRRSGLHFQTKKPIDPVAPATNPSRLADVAKVRKWLKRNCLWTLGRECTAQEKGDLLTFIKSTS